MVDVASAVINKAVDMAANMITEESSRLHWLREDVGWLEREMRHMQGYLENAEAKKFTNPNVVNLIKDIRDLVHDVEDILDIYHPEIESHSSNGLLKRMSTCFMPYGWSSSMFSREIEKIKKRVEGIDADRARYGIEDISATHDVSNVDPRTTRLHVDDPIIVGSEQHIDKLKSKLEEHHFVSIVGMPGLGKTTLAKKFFKDIKDGFDCYASVSVSQTPNIASLIRDIAKQVGVTETDKNLEVNIYSFLQGKRYVVFLDDIWDTGAWDSLKECFPIDSGGASKIIITSRYSNVGRYIGDENSLHELRPFDDSTSWELFSKLVMPTNKKFDSEHEMIGKEIVKKCGGVPLAIVVTVGMLREERMSEFSWNRVLHSIGENANDKCSQILGLSFRDLPTYLKPCFLYFGNFPEDHEFSASQVIRLWMAEKFIPRVHVASSWEPEDVGADYLSKLEARNLIQDVKRGYDGRVKEFRIHDLFHNLCVNMSREIDFLNTIDHLEAGPAERVRRLAGHHHSIAGNEKIIHQMTKLRALFHVKFDDIIEIKRFNNMFRRFKLLNVLILEFDRLHISDVYIPSEIGSLSRLNYLQIQAGSGIVTMPRSFKNLKELQTLDLRIGIIMSLPIGIFEMAQIRHLLLRNCLSRTRLMRLLCPCQPVQVLSTNLQTLVGISCSFLKPSWLLKFTNLRKLVMRYVTPEIMEVLCGAKPISQKLETLSCWGYLCTLTRRVSLVNYKRLMKLRLVNVQLKMQQPLELPPSLINLTLSETQLIEDPMRILKNLPKLKFLRLYDNAYCGSKMDCSGVDNFPQLEVLKIIGLKELEELIEGEEMGMPKLRQLIIERCYRLVRIPEQLQQLRMKEH